MKLTIRTITGFISTTDFNRFEELLETIRQTKNSLANAGYEIQTIRITTDVIERSNNIEELQSHLSFLNNLENNNDVNIYHFGSITNENQLGKLGKEKVLEIFLANKKSFLTISAGSEDTSRNLCLQAAGICKDIAAVAPFECRRFALHSGVKESTPFYPASRVFNNSMRIAIGCQCANLAVEEARQANHDYDAFEHNLRKRMEEEFAEISHHIPSEIQSSFIGFDTSLAPFPADEISIANAIEIVLGKPFGSSGTLSLCRLLTRVMKENTIQKTGLCGLMLPVVEDNVLAKRGIEKRYSLKELLLYSSVCATGLDTIPISGNNSIEDIADCYVDLSTLAIKLNKPLSARFFIEPNKNEDDTIKYDWKFACESPIFKL
jgi:uncharacterized protein (UPF0210 family)